MLRFSSLFASVFVLIILNSCKKSEEPIVTEPKLIIKINVDPDQERLGNDGSPAAIPVGNAGQDPSFNLISAHYLEFAPNAFTPLGDGEILYHAPETTSGGASAIDFDQSKIVEPGEIFLSVPLEDVQPGTYEWVRLSLSYQNYDVSLNFGGNTFTATLASFVGFNTYITNYTIKNESVVVNENKLQGYFGFESIGGVVTGQVPQGAITVPNPLFNSSPIPSGSCVVTGKYASPLVISGNETQDITVTMSLSTNKSFEWKDSNGNGKWDVEVGSAEEVVDMGLRGLIPVIE